MSTRDWRPSAPMANLRLRAQLLRRIREYFAAQEVMEVQTPVLSAAAVTEVHLASLDTRIAGLGRFFLQTSPEYAMKRLLAAGSGDIYQIAHAFRDGERGALHNPEFTLLEWYRLGFGLTEIIADCERALGLLLAPRRPAVSERLTYQEAFIRHAGIDPLVASAAELQACVFEHGIDPPSPLPEERDTALDLLMSMVVGPRLGAGRLTFVVDYPASQAALARLKPGDPRVAERFEVYFAGIELANGFHELIDAGEQRRRFEQDLARRRAAGLPQPAPDERLLAALAEGLPDCAGVAVGFDRVVMLAAGADTLAAAMAFTAERS